MTNKPKTIEIVIEKYGKDYYHARIKDTKRSADDCDIHSTIGRLIFENQDFFNVKIGIESKKDPVKKKIGGLLFNTNPGSSL